MLAELKADKWPYTLPGGAVTTTSAKTKLDFDLQRLGATGSLTASTDVVSNNAQLAHGDLDSSIAGRVITIGKIHGSILTGELDGNGMIDLDQPLAATAQMRWRDLDTGTFVNALPSLDGLAEPSPER